MSAAQFALALIRLAAIALPLLLAARFWRRAYLDLFGPLAGLVDVVLVLSALVLGGELLGLVSALHALPLAALSVCLALAGWVLSRRVTPARTRQRRAAPLAAGTTSRPEAGASRGARWPVLVGLTAVIGQWCLSTANVLGGGMLSFDSLWYHMPFAGRFAQTGSVTAIQFTQADPYVAYYPANSELLHGIGISALHGDLLSPFMNLGWGAVFLLACWCLGERWQVQRLTLLAGCLVLALPVLSTTQPGQAFNDVAGLAMLLAGVALVANTGAAHTGPRRPMLAVAGLALGVAVGTKVTFLVPGLAVLFGVPLLAAVGERVRALALVAGGIVLTGGWWYLRNTIEVGNPIGQRLQIGPLVISGPRSALAAEQQGTVLANLKHLPLWGSRFAPGLAHALGILWPLVLLLTVFGCAGGLVLLRDPLVRLIALTGSLAGLVYFVLPTSASGIAKGTTLFEANLRYATPAIALGAVLVPIILARRRPQLVGPAGLVLLAALLASQFERSVWPSQPVRHAVFLAGAAGLLLLPAVARRLTAALAARRGAFVMMAAAAMVSVAGAAFEVQRHYYSHRYLTGAAAVGTGLSSDGGLYNWAQRISHARIALYGALTQYPLYGARDTNRVDYLGRHTSNGGFVPIADCNLWKATVNAGHYDYVVLSPSQTGSVPLSWTADDPAATLALHPGPGYYVFRLHGRLQASLCPQA